MSNYLDKMVDEAKVYIDNNTYNMQNIKPEQLSALTKLIIARALEQPNPQFIREQELLSMISKITDDETANKARDLYHSQYHMYNFDKYLSLLLELCNLLGAGVSKSDAFTLIDAGISGDYPGFKDILDL